MKTFKKRNAGIAIDEAILVTVMVGSLGTFGAVAVPWQSVLGTSASATGVDQLAAIETANQDFYELYGKWPHEMTNGQALSNVVVLMNRQALKYPYSRIEDYKAVLKDMPIETTGRGMVVRHQLGTGRVLQRAAPRGSGYAMEITFEGVPYAMAESIDVSIDGEIGRSTGRVQIVRQGKTAHVVYRANKI